MNATSKLENRSLLDEFRSFDKGGLFDLGHPLLNRIAESFVKVAGIGAVQAVSREAYLTAVEGAGIDSTAVPDIASSKKHRFPGLKGLAAGLYSGITYGLQEARGAHDWKNSMVAGALTGATLALTSEDASHEQVVQCAITGAALSTAANLLTGVF
ncbi:outer envelope pore protein 16-2, chloroplastic isoform X2 [Magnolia sinica]|uniref:outer envelope pore protein 16-2, chloroplastic isoform X2 n=1 Tax=Magnolia sinica TaxID=86752 RepID=UPI00265B20ED|nr:outer envelope pore protein 16-2, chloroplastic isoform X2 [Magnolia sinica]